MITTTTCEVPLGEILLDWAKAEADRIAREVSPQLGAYAARAASGAALSNKDVTMAVIGVLLARGQFFAHFLAHPTRWLVASCPVQEIGALYLDTYFERYCDLPGYPDIRTVAELAERAPKFRLNVPFDIARMHGRPMLVSYANVGPWCVLEGTHRLVESPRRTSFRRGGGTRRPSARRSRCTWRLPTSQPSCRKSAVIRRYPYRGWATARACIRVTSWVWRSLRRPGGYQNVARARCRIRQAFRPEHRPTAITAWVICFLCPGLIIFFRSQTAARGSPAASRPASSSAPCSPFPAP